MRTPRPVLPACALLAACLLLFVSACATTTAGGGAATGDTGVEAHLESGPSAATIPFGSMHRFASGLVVIVSEPTSFQPSKSAYPPSESAIAFEVTVRNETSHRYRLSNMSVTVIADRQEVKQLSDPTQGYTGVANSPKGLPTEREKRVNLAFAVSAKPEHLKFTLSPRSEGAARVTYVGGMDRTTDAAR